MQVPVLGYSSKTGNSLSIILKTIKKQNGMLLTYNVLMLNTQSAEWQNNKHFVFQVHFSTYLFMATPCNRAGHIYFHHVVCFSFFLLLFFFPRLISAVADWMSTILAHMVWVWSKCKFKMQVWNVLHGARCKYRMQKVVKKSPSGHHSTTLSGYIFAY